MGLGRRALSAPLVVLCILAFSSYVSHAGTTVSGNAPVHGIADAQLERILEQIQRQKPDAAVKELDRLIERHPNFRLAHLVRGDMLLARSRPIDTIGNTDHAGQRLADLRAEAHARFRSHKELGTAEKVPRYLLQFSPHQRHAILVDASTSRVFLYENANGQPRLAADYYSTLGRYGIEKEREGDKKTPVGVYHITAKIPGKNLPDLYGWGAFPINYPNEWDKRLGKTGYGIWLHGVPVDNYSRAPRASDGCVALANPDIEEGANTRGEREEAMRDVRRGVNRMQRLIEQILTLARLDPDNPAHHESIDLEDFLNDVQAEFSPVAAAKGVSLALHIRDSATIRGEASSLRALVRNLVDNAIRYTPAHGTVRIALERSGDGASISIADSGPGIPESKRSKVFARFFRVAGDGDETGAGLGLAIAKRAAERLSAVLELHDRPKGDGLVAMIKFDLCAGLPSSIVRAAPPTIE